MRKIEICLFSLFLVCLSLSVTKARASSSETSTTAVKNSSPQTQISHYNDTFEKMRDDIWKRSGVLPFGKQISQIPGIGIQDGRLLIKATTGDFQKGGLTSRYTIKGDFDIQVDCHMNFVDGTEDMDQILVFVAKDKHNRYFTVVGLAKRADSEPSIFATFKEKGEPLSRKWERIGDFQGTLRIVRIDNKITAFYIKRGDPEWKEIGKFSGMPGEVVVGLGLTNFDSRRTSIRANRPVTATFDNFRINSAQEISEEARVSPSTPSTGCDKAPSLFWKGKFASQKEDAYRYYMEATDLCPGFIRPYELVGNHYRKEGNPEKAIEFFTKAAELGSVNYKLYYLLASLFYDRGDLDMAHRQLNKSLSIKSDYPKALALKAKIERATDTTGPQLRLYEPAAPQGIKVTFSSEIITVRGLVTDMSGVARLRINNQEAVLEKDGRFLKDIPLQVGLNHMEIEATDKAGNRSGFSVTVEREAQPKVAATLSPEEEKAKAERQKRLAAEKERQKKIETELAEQKEIEAGIARQKELEFELARRQAEAAERMRQEKLETEQARKKAEEAELARKKAEEAEQARRKILAAIKVRKEKLMVELAKAKTLESELAKEAVAAMGPIDIGRPGTARQFYRKSFAVVVGINEYEKWPVLEFGIADAKAVKARLEEEGFDDITVILGREATQRRILTALYDYLPKKVQRHDRVVFYFAGHGQTHDLPNGGKEGYIIPVDAGVDNYTSTGISMDQIRGLSSRISAKHILYIMDSCYSGLGFSRGMITVSPELEGYLRKISSMRVVQIITAGGKGEQVKEKEGHGLFTTYFMHALRGEADFNKDNVVTGSELGAYLRPAVSNASGQAQTPLYGRLEGEGEFLFFVGKK